MCPSDDDLEPRYLVMVSPNERREVKLCLAEYGCELQMPYDFRLHTRKGTIAVERKKFPQDMLASVEDGRLAKECAAMRSARYGILISEGVPRYNDNGYLMNGHRVTRWTRSGLRNLYRSIRYCEGIDVEFTRNIPETIKCLHELQSYFDSDDHTSIRIRPHFDPTYLYKTDVERYIYWLQGFPSIGYDRACILAKSFPSPDIMYSATEHDLRRVKGIGKGLAKTIYTFLHTKPLDQVFPDVSGPVVRK